MHCDDRLVEITCEQDKVLIDLIYAQAGNLTGRPIYATALCLLRREAATCLHRATELAALCDLRLKILDAYRPPEAQERLWQCIRDPRYVAKVEDGSNHSRGAAVDLTFVNAQGEELDMGTPFDAMEDLAHHFVPGLPAQVQRNRLLLLGIMTQAGFRYLDSEWWHYDLPEARSFPLLQDGRITCCAQ